MKKFLFIFFLLLTAPLLAKEAWEYAQDGWDDYYADEATAALKDFEKAIDADRDYGWAWHGAATVLLWQLSDYEGALSYSLKAAELLPEEFYPQSQLGWNYYYLEDYDAGISQFAVLTNLFPYQSTGYNGLGNCFYQTENYDDAVKNFLLCEDLLRLSNDTDSKWPMLTACYYYLQEGENLSFAAENAYEFYGEETPTWAMTTAGNYWNYSAFPSNPEAALTFYEYALLTDPDEATRKSLSSYMAYAYYQLQDLDSAWEMIQDSGEIDWLYWRLAPKLVTMEEEFDLKSGLGQYGNYYLPGSYEIKILAKTGYQDLISVSTAPAYAELIEREDGWYLMMDFSRGFPENFSVTREIEIRTENHVPSRLQTYTDENTETGYYANHADSEVEPDDEILIELTKEITSGLSSAMEKVIAIHEWVDTNITHIYTIDPDYYSDPSTYPVYDHISEMLTSEIGHCYHFSRLFASMCRIVHVPAKLIGGFVISATAGEYTGEIDSHYTVELYDPDEDFWFYVEPQNADFFGINSSFHIIEWKESDRDTDRMVLNIKTLRSACEDFSETGSFSIELLDD